MKYSKKILGILIMFLTVISAMADVQIKKDQEAWSITTDKYSAVIGKTGYLSSIVVNGQEFLSNAKGIPGGSYIAANGILPLERLAQTGENTISGGNVTAQVTYEFLSDKIILTIENITATGSFYVLINQSVKTMNYVQGVDSVPTIAAVPAKVTCNNTRWFIENTYLDIIGCNKIWGPWHEHQVWDAEISLGQKKVIEFIPGTQKMVDVQINKDQEIWNITAGKYNAVIGKTGYLSSIVVNGHEFLSNAKGIPGGSYIAANGILPLEKLTQTGENTISGGNLIAQMTYEFLPNKIILTIENVTRKGSFYVLINQSVQTMNYVQGSGGVPTTATVPAEATCNNTRWFIENTYLDIIGCNKIWGPWHEHQVWDAGISLGQKKVIEFIPGTQKTDEGFAKEISRLQKNFSYAEFTYGNNTEPTQIPLCMIGDSITWADQGDYWRKYLLEFIPRLAFVGTHTATLGYSHAGEGGNSTARVLLRMDKIPDCPYYSLLIGTNDTGVKNDSECQQRAEQTAERIQQIISGLLNKNGVKKSSCVAYCHAQPVIY